MVESMEDGAPYSTERDKAPLPRAYHSPDDQAYDGCEPPGDVVLVDAPLFVRLAPGFAQDAGPSSQHESPASG